MPTAGSPTHLTSVGEPVGIHVNCEQVPVQLQLCYGWSRNNGMTEIGNWMEDMVKSLDIIFGSFLSRFLSKQTRESRELEAWLVSKLCTQT